MFIMSKYFIILIYFFCNGSTCYTAYSVLILEHTSLLARADRSC
jgi:hypothetical protein